MRDDFDLKEMGLYSRVGLKVSIVDGLNQLFCDLNDLLFPHCRGKNPAIYPCETGILPSDAKPSPIHQRIPCDFFDKDPIPNVGFLLRRCSGKGLHLAMTGEPRGFSRVTAGFSSYDGEFSPGIEPRSSALQEDSLPAEPPGKPKNTGVGSLSLLPGIFPTQESNRGLQHCRRILYQLSY